MVSRGARPFGGGATGIGGSSPPRLICTVRPRVRSRTYTFVHDPGHVLAGTLVSRSVLTNATEPPSAEIVECHPPAWDWSPLSWTETRTVEPGATAGAAGRSTTTRAAVTTVNADTKQRQPLVTRAFTDTWTPSWADV